MTLCARTRKLLYQGEDTVTHNVTTMEQQRRTRGCWKEQVVMEGAALRDTGWPDPSHSDLHEEKMGAMVFPLAECLECEQTAESEDELSDQHLSLEDEINGERDFREIIGNNTRLKVVLENVRI